MKIRFLTAAGVWMVLLGIVYLPQLASSEEKESKEEINLLNYPVHAIHFITNDEAEMDGLMDRIKQRKDDSIGGAKEKLSQDKLLVTSGSTLDRLPISADEQSIAAHVNKVKQDPALQKLLHEQLKNGNRIYLYGGLTAELFKELLLLEEMKIKADVGDLEGFINLGESQKEKGPLKASGRTEVEQTSIISFKLDEQVQYQYFEVRINGGGTSGTDQEEMFIQEILFHQSRLADRLMEEQ
ncbi:hypothetical protein P6709_07170 [Jeotgalibacillus sp. ET6]|uniref:hypothetical protein n=1 Tax=Jeotgalibacillus sp. ET6 TaxID=3037260 RepID=UPI0024189476|nr:hypothetical protein [Jeotgalibacillus sp. ET6]MDG5471524.1 hypothetical protein [Jeotgalibacillus sp. ET6]